eukprot:TRINITY_DN14436_c0_g1_i1.p1 TRINITY_DN14436_c0_g1~~TRINITY_DN14436_c0_g1_i1.p1  ORF type:complete len:205 (+),score=36.52 TRINITY_DN14436_c0_g1_i1:67-681(+)
MACLAALLLLLCGAGVQPRLVKWLPNATDTNWWNGENWSSGSVPTQIDDCLIGYDLKTGMVVMDPPPTGGVVKVNSILLLSRVLWIRTSFEGAINTIQEGGLAIDAGNSSVKMVGNNGIITASPGLKFLSGQLQGFWQISTVSAEGVGAKSFASAIVNGTYLVLAGNSRIKFVDTNATFITCNFTAFHGVLAFEVSSFWCKFKQ